MRSSKLLTSIRRYAFIGALFLPCLGWAAGTAAWERGAPLPTPRVCLGVVEAGGKLYAVGGGTMLNRQWINNDSVECYDPLTNTWSARKRLPMPRGSFGIVSIGGKIFVLGGVRVVDGRELDLNTVEEYNPATDTWRARRDMPTARQQVCAAVVDGKIYAIGGKNNELTVEVYDPETDSWTSRAKAPYPSRSAAAVTVDGKIYVIGGHRLNGNAVLEYNPSSDAWSRRRNMPTGRTDLAAAAIGRKIYVFGGHGHIKATEEYDPATDIWVARSPLPEARGYHGAASIGGKLFVVGGALEIHRGNELSTVECYDPALDR